MDQIHLTPNQPGGAHQSYTGGSDPKNELHEGSRAQESVVDTGYMASSEVLRIFQSCGVPALTHRLNSAATYPKFPYCSDYSNIYHSRLENGTDATVQCIRMSVKSSEEHTLKSIAHDLHIWSKCNHPNILEVFGATEFHGEVAIISPWAEPLHLFLYEGTDAPVDVYGLCVQIAEAVAYLHHTEIVRAIKSFIPQVHGDINGMNILVSKDRTIKLSGFGNGKISRSIITRPMDGPSELVLFLVRWASPEALSKDMKGPTVHSDVYSLAMTILEIISGLEPYHDVQAIQFVIANIMRGIPPNRPAQLSDDIGRADRLWALLENCWAFDPSTRPTASHVLEVMKELSAMTPSQGNARSASLPPLTTPLYSKPPPPAEEQFTDSEHAVSQKE
ncbi:tyrosine kinase domain protein [Rhizoctonia solani 123E]|uniref:Tyrosine kinase domain protein n=1 Tax=Rhizoctonia solani 123E TaxID=1423351 RepID=A0A074RJY7_9AGAM|nr:tyrosine kinase domain protein [Rhizoctonia solani 123E]